MKKNLYFKVMGLVAVTIVSTFIFIKFYILRTFQERLIEEVPKTAVDTAYSIVESYHKRVEQKEFDEDSAKSKAITTLKNLRIGNNDYFWIHNLELKMVMHPIKPELDNTDISLMQSSNGHRMFFEMNEMLKQSNGEGWYHYQFPRAGEIVSKEKTSYLKVDKKWNWVIGSGMYVEDIELQMAPFFKKIEISLGVIFILALVIGHFVSRRISFKLLEVSNNVEKTAFNVDEITLEARKSIETLAQISIEQASALEETAAAVHEINMMAEQNTKNAKDALLLSEDNKVITMQGQATLKDLENAINQIENSIAEMAKATASNYERFDEIFKVMSEINNKTKVINDIVFQTKLLSFNASVEAARAEEHGKGFGVVAEEVGKLAKVSGDASLEINKLIAEGTDKINSIILDSKKIIEQLSEVTSLKMKEGHGTAKEFTVIFNQMINNIDKMNCSIIEMSSASREQGSGITQINVAITQLTDSGNLSMNSTENIKMKVGDLAGDVDDLKKSVVDLKLEVIGA